MNAKMALGASKSWPENLRKEAQRFETSLDEQHTPQETHSGARPEVVGAVLGQKMSGVSSQK